VDGTLGQQTRQGVAVEQPNRLAIPPADRLRAGDEATGFDLMPGESRQTAPAPLRVGKGRGHRVAPVDPAFGDDRLAGAAAARR
jgi:hypothetical protein